MTLEMVSMASVISINMICFRLHQINADAYDAILR